MILFQQKLDNMAFYFYKERNKLREIIKIEQKKLTLTVYIGSIFIFPIF